MDIYVRVVPDQAEEPGLLEEGLLMQWDAAREKAGIHRSEKESEKGSQHRQPTK